MKNEVKKAGERRLKVVKRFFERKYSRFAVFPEIRLAGKWLQQSGFAMGQTVVVKHSKNKLVITVEGGSRLQQGKHIQQVGNNILLHSKSCIGIRFRHKFTGPKTCLKVAKERSFTQWRKGTKKAKAYE